MLAAKAVHQAMSEFKSKSESTLRVPKTLQLSTLLLSALARGFCLPLLALPRITKTLLTILISIAFTVQSTVGLFASSV